VDNQRQCVLNLIGKKYTYDLLYSVADKPKRFKDLSEIVSNKRTLSKRLAVLNSNGLIEKVLVKKKGGHLAYSLTPKGKKILSLIDSF